jgi:hypothetical protein
MSRIYFLAPNINVTQKIVDELLSADIEESHIHVIGKDGENLEKVPEASFLQKSDFIPSLQLGTGLGAATGLLCGLVALALPTGLILGGGAVLAISLTGAGLGAFSSTLIGIGIESRWIEPFVAAIEKGEFLVLIDLAPERIEEIEKAISKHHPEAEYKGIESHVSA